MTYGTDALGPRPQDRQHVGVVASFDFPQCQEQELRRWIPPGVTCTVVRTEEVPYQDNRELVSRLGNPHLLAHPVRELAARGATQAVAYHCTACSFSAGVPGERALREAMSRYGARHALTTSSAVVDALRAVGASRVAVVHPYQEPVDRMLHAYLRASGLEVVHLESLGLGEVEDVYVVDGASVHDAVLQGDHPDADALFVSCTALPTYDVLPALEARLRKPVISANQATAWALAGAVGQRAVGPAQRLLHEPWRPR